MSSIVIIDYGMGNLHSAAKAVARAVDKAKVKISSDAADIKKADRVIFPGVGAMRDCMKGLDEFELNETIRQVAKDKPFLAVCVGMQALMTRSEENDGVNCLDMFPGKVRFFGNNLSDEKSGDTLKIPHMGWNQVKQTHAHPLWRDIENYSRFYFVHSYYVAPENDQIISGSCEYGLQFAASITRENVFAVQFHPEKSHKAGLTLLSNFALWNGEV